MSTTQAWERAQGAHMNVRDRGTGKTLRKNRKNRIGKARKFAMILGSESDR